MRRRSPFVQPLEPVLDIDDAESGPDGIAELADPPRRRPAPRLSSDGLALVVAGAVRLEAARRGLSQQQLATELGLSRTAVSARFRGRVAWSLDEVGLLAQLFGCRVVELVTEAPTPAGRSVW
ncbi:helix-turn-helix transcriptional regulator [Isoptericola chiayiensis]|uniref:helix-turn-helix transcriptional regulator n=1 Tax=Isoptericola chiayiensis TaxID=579446 RepID=UPI0015583001|nr:helix-turn-helix transcriptional regulator [Isoptericola chiayiensis]NOW02114.1 ribosome-binding protein aMBF1 (putative translation factor) [Isoptericola chiayiensis]